MIVQNEQFKKNQNNYFSNDSNSGTSIVATPMAVAQKDTRIGSKIQQYTESYTKSNNDSKRATSKTMTSKDNLKAI
ncbi:12346_t:CDS:2, partial [Gigaspora margarita]